MVAYSENNRGIIRNMSESRENKLDYRTLQVFELLDDWGTSAQEKITLLCLEGHAKPRNLSRFRRGEALPDVNLIQDRIEHLLGIADALRTMNPHNSQIGSIWMNKIHRRFENRTPLNTMLEDGLQGILYVRRHVDCAFDWQQDEIESVRSK